jgi:hypothetical protein
MEKPLKAVVDYRAAINKTVMVVVLACLLSHSGTATADPLNKTPSVNRAVLVELFTSEGCSSCPPADQVLTRLQAQPMPGVDIIALSEHVLYWNYLGWIDPYSQEIFSKRQRRYASVFRKPSVYTPQLVIDGKVELVGSNYGQAVLDIKSAAAAAKADIDLNVSTQSPNQIFLKARIRLPESTRATRATVIVALVEDHLLSYVKTGENAGSRLAHNSVVRELIELGEIRGSELFDYQKAVRITAPLKAKNMRLVLFIQAAGAEILGAATTKLSS